MKGSVLRETKEILTTSLWQNEFIIDVTQSVPTQLTGNNTTTPSLPLPSNRRAMSHHLAENFYQIPALPNAVFEQPTE